MSKLLEALKASTKDYPQQPPASGAAAPETAAKSDYELTQEQLAEIYFSSGEAGAGKKRAELPPMVVKVIERPQPSNLIPWIITSIAFLITAFSLFSTKRIFVDIRVVDDARPVAEGKSAPVSAAPDEGPGSRSMILRGTLFEGAAKLKSTASREGLTLVNSSVSPFAQASVRFPAPLDLTGGKVVFYVKGAQGGEKLGFAMKDRDNVLAFPKGKIFPFPEGLTTDWQRVEIPLSSALHEFNARSVVSLRFEFGSNIQNRPGDTVFIKDLQVLP